MQIDTYLFICLSLLLRVAKSGLSAGSSAQHFFIIWATSSSDRASPREGRKGCPPFSPGPLRTASTFSANIFSIELGF